MTKIIINTPDKRESFDVTMEYNLKEQVGSLIGGEHLHHWIEIFRDILEKMTFSPDDLDECISVEGAKIGRR